MTWLVAFFLINGLWTVENVQVGFPEHCQEALSIMKSASLPFTDVDGRKIEKIYALCVTPE